MRTILFILLCSISLSAALPFTLENLKNLRIYVINKSDFITKQQEAELKEAIAKKLTAAGIVLNEPDSSTFMIKVESVKVDTTYIVNIGIAVGEEIITKRKDAIQTLAFTYHANDFIDTKEPYIETLESIHYLVEDFIDLHNEDKE